MRSGFKFNGISTNDLGLVIQTPPTYNYPNRDMENVHVPGRNGDLFIDKKCYNNVERSYLLGKGYKPGTNYYTNSETILKWLNEPKGKYCRLEDSYDNEVYRIAMFNMSGSFIDYYNEMGAVTISFICKPQRYLLIGEEPIYNVGPYSTVNNIYGYDALPIIKIDNLITSSYVIMLTVKNGEDVVSSVTMSGLNTDNIVIDSEEQTVTDSSENHNNLSYYIGLNGKEFPSLKVGTTEISVEEYDIVLNEVSSYKSTIESAQEVAKSEYKPYVALEIDNQSTVKIRSYNSYISNKQEIYTAPSVQALATEQSKEYTFISFNDIMDTYAKSCSFAGPFSSTGNPTEYLDWINATDDGTYISATAKKTGYFITSDNSTKKLILIRQNETIFSNLKNSASLTVTYYPAESYVESGITKYRLGFSYDNIPDWAKVVITYDSNYSPTRLQYMAKSEGYYWKDKERTFGKATWLWNSSGNETVLSTLNWEGDKRAFMPDVGLFTSTTKTYTYRYISSLPVYENVTTEETTDSGKKIVKILSRVRFSIVDNSNPKDMSNIQVKVIPDDPTINENKGWYAYLLNEASNHGSWTSKNQNDDIISSISGTDSFTIFYFKPSPEIGRENLPDITYADEEGWPDWLDPYPVKLDDPSTLATLNDEEIAFKVNNSSLYRYSYLDSENNEKYSDWVSIQSGNIIDTSGHGVKEFDESYILCQIDELPDVYNFDRRYIDKDGNITDENPDWLDVSHEDIDGNVISDSEYENMEQEEKDALKVVYRVSSSSVGGRIKWDSNESWRQLKAEEVGTTLLVTNNKDNTTFYFLEGPDLPEASTYSLFDIIPTSDSNGNPNLVTFKAKVQGYFRSNNSSDWTMFDIGQTILESNVNNGNIIRYLSKVSTSDEDLEDLNITIIPRWWML